MIATLSGLVYLLCFLTAALCAALLVRRYFATPSPVLLWSAACFVFLALTNLLVAVGMGFGLGPDAVAAQPPELWLLISQQVL